MLSPDDAGLVRRDSALPGLAVLLDPNALAEVVQQSVPGVKLGGVQINYVRYKPGVSCLVGYTLDAAGTAIETYAKTFQRDDLMKLRKRPGRGTVAGPLGQGHFVWEDRGIVLYVFPNDTRLESLTRLASEESRTRLLRKMSPRLPDLWDSSVRTLRYKPERRYVGQLVTASGPQGVVRCYAESGYQTAHTHTKHFRTDPPLRVASRIGRSARHRMLVFEWLPGRLLNEAMMAKDFDPQALIPVGAALTALHSQKPEGLVQRTREEEAQSLLELAAGVGELCPSLGARAERIARSIADRLLTEPVTTGTIHGDFYAKQVLLAGDEVAVLDLDQAVRGDPAADLGNFVAHLERDALRGNIAPDRVSAFQDALFEGYRAATGQPVPGRCALYTAAGLIRLAHDPFRYREPDWAMRTEAIISKVEELLGRSPSPRRREVEVVDPFGCGMDAKMPFLVHALDPHWMQRHFPGKLRAIRVTRCKTGRRCLIEYEMEDRTALIGKVRAKGLDDSAYRLLESLRQTGFGPDAADGVQVPRPVALIPELQMWLQEKVPGTTATRLLPGPGGVALARRIAEAIHKLHAAGIPARKRHTMADELQILHERVPLVAEKKPHWAERIDRVLEMADRLGATVPEPHGCGIHRDFYADHVIVDGRRLSLVDFDLYCEGDPGLDAGNFIAHLTEQSLRELGDASALSDREQALEERFMELAGERTRGAVRAYTTLTLVRHIYLSTLFPERQPFTEALLELCEQRLGIGKTSREAVHR